MGNLPSKNPLPVPWTCPLEASGPVLGSFRRKEGADWKWKVAQSDRQRQLGLGPRVANSPQSLFEPKLKEFNSRAQSFWEDHARLGVRFNQWDCLELVTPPLLFF